MVGEGGDPEVLRVGSVIVGRGVVLAQTHHQVRPADAKATVVTRAANVPGSFGGSPTHLPEQLHLMTTCDTADKTIISSNAT